MYINKQPININSLKYIYYNKTFDLIDNHIHKKYNKQYLYTIFNYSFILPIFILIFIIIERFIYLFNSST